MMKEKKSKINHCIQFHLKLSNFFKVTTKTHQEKCESIITTNGKITDSDITSKDESIEKKLPQDDDLFGPHLSPIKNQSTSGDHKDF